jgi:hypothetical protein
LWFGTPVANVPAMEMKLELVPIPVADIDRDPDGNSWTLQEMSWRKGGLL